MVATANLINDTTFNHIPTGKELSMVFFHLPLTEGEMSGVERGGLPLTSRCFMRLLP